MSRLFGLILIFISCGIGGQYFASRLCARLGFLRQWQRGLLALSTEISYSLLPLPQALKNSGRQAGGAVGGFLAEVGEALEQSPGKSAEQLWLEQSELLYAHCHTLPQERELIADLALGLGFSDRNDQLKKLELYRKRFDELEKAAEGEYAKMGRVYRTLGWGGGAMLVLLFI